MFSIGSLLIVSFFCAYHFANRWGWLIALSVSFIYLIILGQKISLVLALLFSIIFAIYLPLSVALWRKRFMTKPIFKLYQSMMPEMSTTEKEAIEAGSVAWEGQLFSGIPKWSMLVNQPSLHLTEEEQQFIDGPVEILCRMADDWEITHECCDLPKALWDYIKSEGFWGLNISTEYGGKGFSEWAHAVILMKLCSKSIVLGTTVSVPNSLGPSELLLQYGTSEQKSFYLPRLATGQEIPCFALTSAEAGSDASAMPDYGIVTEGVFEGKKILGISLNWNKRYITLAPVATLLGLAFKLYDPEKKLSETVERGITLALIPTDQPGITIGRRHFPLNTPFMNGPTQGRHVFIPLDWVIGGEAMIGQGWRMLMECLGSGRAISLPSSAAGSAKAAALASGSYARVRKQFGTAIGNFEGIQTPLSRIVNATYMMDATIRLTLIAIEQGERPSVGSAIAKYHCTELGRKIAIDAMDIHGGKGICLGPNNYLGRSYQAAPIGITVEGANILTRCLIIFGQGLIRCHPYILKEIDAVSRNDLNAFDTLFFAHMRHLARNTVRTLIAGLTGSRHFIVPIKGKCYRHFQQFNRFASALAFCSEVAMISLGGKLKRLENLSARLGDVLSYLYIGSAIIKKYHDDAYPPEDKVFIDWSCQYLLYEIQNAFLEFFDNFPFPVVGFFLKRTVFPLGAHFKPPSDKLSSDAAKRIMTPSESRDRLIQFIHLDDDSPLGTLYNALPIVIQAEPIEKRIQNAYKSGELIELNEKKRFQEALEKKLIDEEDYQLLEAVYDLRQRIIAVDDFSNESLKSAS